MEFLYFMLTIAVATGWFMFFPAVSSPVSGDTERPTYNLPSGMVCYKCPIGMKVKEDCMESLTQPDCEPCDPHHYSTAPNGEDHCQRCKSSCPKNSHVVQNCTASTNLICQCRPGHYEYPIDAIETFTECRPHSACPEGAGVRSGGNHTHDATCRNCTVGLEFVNMTNPKRPVCQPCSSCPAHSQLVVACTMSSDTQCQYNDSTGNMTTAMPKDSNLAEGAIIGIVIVCLLVPALIIGVIVFIIRRKKQASKKKSPDSNGMEMNGGDRLIWSLEFIETKVFPFLKDHLGQEWTHFIRSLPGWSSPARANALIEQRQEEANRSVANQIYGCLTQWKSECHEHVTKDNICDALTQVNRADLVDQLNSLGRSVQMS